MCSVFTVYIMTLLCFGIPLNLDIRQYGFVKGNHILFLDWRYTSVRMYRFLTMKKDVIFEVPNITVAC